MRLSTTTERFFDDATDAIATCALLKSGPNSCRCLSASFALELGGELLLIALRSVLRAADVLLAQRDAVVVQRLVRGLERRQRGERRLVERADIGDVGGADRRRRDDRGTEGEARARRPAARERVLHAES